MSILYGILELDDLCDLTDEQKFDFVCEIISTGNFEHFNKFKGLLGDNLVDHIDSNKILELLPINIDPKLIEYVLTNYKFKQGQHFFYNYAIHHENYKIREMVYNYFVENYSHIMIDNMDMYESLLEK